jgi:hypothetical protein
MARFLNRSAVTGRFQTVDPERDLVPENVSADDVCEVSDNSICRPAAPRVTDDAGTGTALPQRVRVDEYGLRDPFGRVDQHLVEQAQAGTDRVPGTWTGDT